MNEYALTSFGFGTLVCRQQGYEYIIKVHMYTTGLQIERRSTHYCVDVSAYASMVTWLSIVNLFQHLHVSYINIKQNDKNKIEYQLKTPKTESEGTMRP